MYSKHKCALGLKPGFGLKRGFSLVELMISLIVVSVVAAAFSPVITKKLSSNTVVAGATKAISSIRSDCASFNTSGGVCSVCTDSLCLSCTLDNCDENQGKYKNIGKCSCEACTSRSAYCVKCNSKDCTKCAENYYLDSLSNCQSCPSGKYCDGSNSQKNCTSNCKTCDSSLACENCSSGYYLNNSNCISCSAGYFCDGSTNQQTCGNNQYSTGGSASCQDVSKVTNCKTYFKTKNECQECNEKYYLKSNKCYPVTQVANCSTYSKTEDKCESCEGGYILQSNKCIATKYADLIYGLYVTKYNMGDHQSTQFPAAANVTSVSVGTNCTGNKCCWTGATSGSNCDSVNGIYSGCNRTVCTWEAANAICENYNQDGRTWRLPTSGEMGNWSNYSKGKSYNGLMFCDISSGYSSAYCAGSTACLGANLNACNPSYVWSESCDGIFAYIACTINLDKANWRNYALSSGTWGNQSKALETSAYSVRCVSGSITNCSTYNINNACTGCKSCCYLTGGKCVQHTTVENCSSYSKTEDKCTACNDGYSLSSNGKKCY